MNFLIVLACVSAVSIAGIMVSELCFRNRLGWFSFSVKATLATSIALPVALLLANFLMPDGLIKLAVLPMPTQASDVNVVPDLRTDRTIAHGNGEQQFMREASTNEALGSSFSFTTVGPTSPASPEADLRNEQTIASKDNSFTLLVIISYCWLAGVALFMARILVGFWATRKLAAATADDEPSNWSPLIDEVSDAMQLRKRLTVRSSEKISCPFVVGALRPRILVPDNMTYSSLGEKEIRCVLLHEGSHVKQNDCLWNFVTRISQALWWPIPMVHWLAGRFHESCEKICDLNVAQRVSTAEYAETLLSLVTTEKSGQPRIFGLSMYHGGGSLESRIAWLFDNTKTRVGFPRIRTQLLCAASLILLLGASLVVRFVEPQPEAIMAMTALKTPAELELQEKESEAEGNNAAVDEENAKAFIGGLIQDPDGVPLAGATVYLLKNDGSSGLPKHAAKTKTDQKGRYRYENVSPGTYGLWAESGKFTSLKSKWKNRRFRVTDESKGSDEIDLKLHVGCSYRVKVQSSVTGEPIENARITFGWTDIEREYKTGVDGVALIEGLSPSDWYFVVKADGLATQFRKTASQELGHTEFMQFDLDPGASFQVSLRDDNDDPVVGAKFWIDPADSGMTPNYDSKVTDANGEFVVKGIPVGEEVRLVTMIGGYDTGGYRATANESDKLTKVELKCKKTPYGGDVLFTVVDEDGNPIENASLKNDGRSSNLFRRVTTDENGKALMQNLYRSLDECSVVVTADGMIGKKFFLVPGTKENPAKQTIKLLSGGSLSGVIRYPNGKPVSNARVYFNGGHHGRGIFGPVGATGPIGGRTRTDAEGSFEIAGLPENSTLTVYTPAGYQPIERLPVSVVKGKDNSVQIDLEMEAVIRVRAIDEATGDAIPKFNVKIDFCRDRREDDPKTFGGINSTLIKEGVNVHGTTKEYVLDHQVPGVPYAIIVSAEGYETRKLSRVVAVLRDQAKLLDVKLKKK
jgi:beta-lactamase regulating signal transducer with metallopeptidase domain